MLTDSSLTRTDSSPSSASAFLRPRSDYIHDTRTRAVIPRPPAASTLQLWTRSTGQLVHGRPFHARYCGTVVTYGSRYDRPTIEKVF